MAISALGTLMGGQLGFTCLTGTVVPQPQVGIPLPGDFLLQSGGRTIAALIDAGAGLARFVGRRVTVCGGLGAPVEGVPVLRATTVIGAPAGFPPAGFPPLGFRVQCFLVPSFGGAAVPLGGAGGIPGLGTLGGISGLGTLGGISALF